ncbi:CPBP family intramembrane glutamic endopeptidase [Planctomicrobium sp. SH527]|uniref:CPBP family intramembrane glutamic endopeptidase n=1 Tax=Planctomicrobium sp. SH527 TaxID=3448123 RepID=UPI003F5C76C9
MRTNWLTRRQHLPVSQDSAACSIFEALAWMAGFLFAQAIALAAVLTILYTSSFGLIWPNQKELVHWILDTNLDRSFLLIGTPVLGAVFLLLPLIRWREGQNYRERIGWRTPTVDEFVISLATVCPIALIGNLLYEVTNLWWKGEEVIAWTSATAIQQTSLEHLYSTFHGVPYPILIVAMALAPAFLEELIFRGVLGRRLVGRYGVTAGVLLSSTCFAAVHGSLPHALATLPVGILLHLLYLQTGTIWVPVLVHFGNNLLAVSLVHFNLQQESTFSPTLVFSMSLYLVMMLALLSVRTQEWQLRNQQSTI